jgi:hypothetical protein
LRRRKRATIGFCRRVWFGRKVRESKRADWVECVRGEIG